MRLRRRPGAVLLTGRAADAKSAMAARVFCAPSGYRPRNGVTAMWTRNSRKLLDDEKRWVNHLSRQWSADTLDALQVVEFVTDNAHTIRNAALAKGRVKPLGSRLAKDGDGALVDVILFETENGEFGELEFNRVDTRPLTGIPELDD